jgi:hypothetical protein
MTARRPGGGVVAATATLFRTLSADDWHRGGRESLRPAEERSTDVREEPLS